MMPLVTSSLWDVVGHYPYHNVPDVIVAGGSAGCSVMSVGTKIWIDPSTFNSNASLNPPRAPSTSSRTTVKSVTTPIAHLAVSA